MSVTLTVVAFFGYLVLSIISSFVLAAGLDRIGVRLHLAPGLFGLVTAIGADAPEVSSAIVALTGGHHNLSFSVVCGSNIFNLAALLGLSAVVAGDVQISRSRLFLNGAAGVLIIAVATALLLGYLSPWLAVVLTVAVFIPYAILVGLHPTHIRRIIPRGWLRDFLSAALTPARGNEPDEQVAKTGGGWREMLSVLLP